MPGRLHISPQSRRGRLQRCRGFSLRGYAEALVEDESHDVVALNTPRKPARPAQYSATSEIPLVELEDDTEQETLRGSA